MHRSAWVSVWAFLIAACIGTTKSYSEFQPILVFMQPQDARDSRGLLEFKANPLQLLGDISVERDTRSAGSDGRRPSFHTLLAVPRADGSCYVFGSRHREAGTEPRTFAWQLFRGITPDGYHLTEWQEVFRNPEGPWLIESGMMHEQTTDNVFFYTWARHSGPEDGHALWGFSSADGLNWQPLSSEPVYVDHDAFGGMWDPRTGRFLMGQVTYQAHRKPYSDNMGFERRRVLTVRVSADGVHWKRDPDAGPDGLITPDDDDPPDLEFYRMQPFGYADRYLAAANLYAASPLTPGVHGPHLGCEWWVSHDGVRWARPWRDVDAQGDAAYAIKMTPMWFGNQMLFWVAGQVFGLPVYRVASVGSRSNAEFSSRVFEMPNRPLLLNATVPGGRGLFRQAYVAVELQDESGRIIPGYEHDGCILRNVDDTHIRLRWGSRIGEELAGRKVMLRFYLRKARIYAVGIDPSRPHQHGVGRARAD